VLGLFEISNSKLEFQNPMLCKESRAFCLSLLVFVWFRKLRISKFIQKFILTATSYIKLKFFIRVLSNILTSLCNHLQTTWSILTVYKNTYRSFKYISTYLISTDVQLETTIQFYCKKLVGKFEIPSLLFY
jgi:hypothetical protein